jgi:hypothetical protein
LIRNATLITRPEGYNVLPDYDGRVAIINEMLTTDPTRPDETRSIYRSVLTVLDGERRRVFFKVLDLEIKHISFTYYKRKDPSFPEGYELVHDIVIVSKRNHVYFYSDDSKILEKHRVKEITLSKSEEHVPLELDHARMVPMYPVKMIDQNFRQIKMIGVCPKDESCEDGPI